MSGRDPHPALRKLKGQPLKEPRSAESNNPGGFLHPALPIPEPPHKANRIVPANSGVRKETNPPKKHLRGIILHSNKALSVSISRSWRPATRLRVVCFDAGTDGSCLGSKHKLPPSLPAAGTIQTAAVWWLILPSGGASSHARTMPALPMLKLVLVLDLI